MFLVSVAEIEIVSIVNELSAQKSADYIGLNMDIFKHVIPNIAKPLCFYIYISKQSLLDGDFQIR